MTTEPITALVVVDCQNDFADPAGSLFVEGSDRVITETNRLIIEAVSARNPVFYTQDWHPESTPHFAKDGGIWPVHCVADSWGAEFHPKLIVAGPSIRKGSNGEDGYSGFTMRDAESGNEIPTDLHESLQAAGASGVIVAGLALDYCVRATALDAVDLGYETTLIMAATAAVDLSEGDGEAARRELIDRGVAVLEQ